MRARECTRRAVELLSEAESKVKLGAALRTLGEVTEAAAQGSNPLGEASEHLKRSIAIFEELGNDMELARSYRAYAALLRRMPEHARDATVAAQARELQGRAEDIFAKMRATVASFSEVAVV